MTIEATAAELAEFDVASDLYDIEQVSEELDTDEMEMLISETDFGDDSDNEEPEAMLGQGDNTIHQKLSIQDELRSRRRSKTATDVEEDVVIRKKRGFGSLDYDLADDPDKFLALGNPCITSILTGETVAPATRSQMKMALQRLSGSSLIEKSSQVKARYDQLWATYHAGMETVKPGGNRPKLNRYTSPEANCRVAPIDLFFVVEDYKEEKEKTKANPSLEDDSHLAELEEEVARKLGVAKEMCRKCVVRDSCLEFAMDNRGLSGVMGGLTHTERKSFNTWLRKRERTPEQVQVYVETKRAT